MHTYITNTTNNKFLFFFFLYSNFFIINIINEWEMKNKMIEI